MERAIWGVWIDPRVLVPDYGDETHSQTVAMKRIVFGWADPTYFRIRMMCPHSIS